MAVILRRGSSRLCIVHIHSESHHLKAIQGTIQKIFGGPQLPVFGSLLLFCALNVFLKIAQSLAFCLFLKNIFIKARYFYDHLVSVMSR